MPDEMHKRIKVDAALMGKDMNDMIMELLSKGLLLKTEVKQKFLVEKEEEKNEEARSYNQGTELL